ncbi:MULTISPECIES: MHYT domain-containing protein [unclassified Frankia]|uniref:MHYT domain-containing protein n=1 Tax=unclassified Frankia TaxID=2632575 RepID=UPI002AD4D581|nr:MULTISPECIES: MHYT domain-containing protein [unclassified Frankia]
MTTVRPLGGSAVENLAAAHAHFTATYDLGFVGLSYLLAAVGSFAALASAARIRATRGGRRLRWITVTAVALGGGAVWSMHFVGMLAYHIGPDITFNLSETLLSLGISIAGAALGLCVVGTNPFNTTRLITGGACTGFAITAMHYTGMAAMRTSGTVTYRMPVVVLSVLIAVFAATMAFWIALHGVGRGPGPLGLHRSARADLQTSSEDGTFLGSLGGAHHVITASAVMALAVCTMHYTALAATQVTPEPSLRPPLGFDPYSLGILTTFGSSIILLFIIFAALGGVGEPELVIRRIRPKGGQRPSRVHRDPAGRGSPDERFFLDKPAGINVDEIAFGRGRTVHTPAKQPATATQRPSGLPRRR